MPVSMVMASIVMILMNVLSMHLIVNPINIVLIHMEARDPRSAPIRISAFFKYFLDPRPWIPDASYECNCKLGFNRIGNECFDVDECKDGVIAIIYDS